MTELARWLFALCVGVAAGCSYALYTFARDWLIHHLGLLIAHLRGAL